MRDNRTLLMDVWPRDHTKIMVWKENKDVGNRLIFKGWADSEDGELFQNKEKARVVTGTVLAGKIAYIYVSNIFAETVPNENMVQCSMF